MNIRSPKPWDTKHGVLSTFGLLWYVFVFKFFISLVCVWLGKTVLFNLYSETSQIDCFCRVHKILRWIGLILNLQGVQRSHQEAIFFCQLTKWYNKNYDFFSLASIPIYIPIKNVSFSKRWKQARMWCQIWSCPEVFNEGHAFCDWPFLIWWF